MREISSLQLHLYPDRFEETEKHFSTFDSMFYPYQLKKRQIQKHFAKLMKDAMEATSLKTEMDITDDIIDARMLDYVKEVLEMVKKTSELNEEKLCLIARII
jgi:hypothetical protein